MTIILACCANIHVFLNLWFAKPRVCMRVAFHKNDGHNNNDENDKDISDSHKQGAERWICGNDGNHESQVGIQGANNGFSEQRVQKCPKHSLLFDLEEHSRFET